MSARGQLNDVEDVAHISDEYCRRECFINDFAIVVHGVRGGNASRVQWKNYPSNLRLQLVRADGHGVCRSCVTTRDVHDKNQPTRDKRARVEALKLPGSVLFCDSANCSVSQ